MMRPDSTVVVTRSSSDPRVLHGVRQLVISALVLHHWSPERVADAEIVISEMVTNAVLHTGTDLEVRVEIDGVARLSVTDELPELQPQVRVPDEGVIGGMGLRLIELLTDRWGVSTGGNTKTVWCEMSPISTRHLTDA